MQKMHQQHFSELFSHEPRLLIQSIRLNVCLFKHSYRTCDRERAQTGNLLVLPAAGNTQCQHTIVSGPERHCCDLHLWPWVLFYRRWQLSDASLHRRRMEWPCWRVPRSVSIETVFTRLLSLRSISVALRTRCPTAPIARRRSIQPALPVAVFSDYCSYYVVGSFFIQSNYTHLNELYERQGKI